MTRKTKTIWPIFMSVLIGFGMALSAHAQSAKERMADFDSADVRPRAVKHTKSRDAVKSLKKNKFLDQAEENLPRVLDRAEENDAVLIFEEADDLFHRGAGDDGQGDDEE